jgi:hypothetical protein
MTEFKQSIPGSFGALDIKYRSPNKDGDLIISNKQLTSLDGCPERVNGVFIVNNNPNLKSLIGGPTDIGAGYSAERCGLTSLEGLPIKTYGSVWLVSIK